MHRAAFTVGGMCALQHANQADCTCSFTGRQRHAVAARGETRADQLWCNTAQTDHLLLTLLQTRTQTFVTVLLGVLSVSSSFKPTLCTAMVCVRLQY